MLVTNIGYFNIFFLFIYYISNYIKVEIYYTIKNKLQ